MVRLLLYFLLLLTIAACGKKVEYDGTVFSKHRIPMPNLPIRVYYSHGGKEQVTGHYETSTDQQGHFSFHQKISRKSTIRYFSVPACDSGRYNAASPARNMEIVLN